MISHANLVLSCPLTSVHQDHTEILGNTHEAIAREKAGIIKSRRPILVSEAIPPAAFSKIAEVADSKNSPLYRVPAAVWNPSNTAAQSTSACFVDGTLQPISFDFSSFLSLTIMEQVILELTINRG